MDPIIPTVPVLVVNLDRSKERWVAMRKAFRRESLTRVKAVDGKVWESEERGAKGRPMWDHQDKMQLIRNRTIAEDSLGPFGDNALWPLLPRELGCALSHMKIWQSIVDMNISCAVVLEDDVEPAEGYPYNFSGLVYDGDLPDANVILLWGERPEDSGYNCMELDEDGTFLAGYGSLGYVISNIAARRSLEIMKPMYECFDRQWYKLAFASCTMENKIPLPALYPGLVVKGLKVPAIRPAKTADKSTMMDTGEKTWVTQGR